MLIALKIALKRDPLIWKKARNIFLDDEHPVKAFAVALGYHPVFLWARLLTVWDEIAKPSLSHYIERKFVIRLLLVLLDQRALD